MFNEKLSQYKARQDEIVQEWSKVWGGTFAYALTQSIEDSELLLRQCILAFETSFEEKRKNCVFFAALVWKAAQPKLFRGFSTDAFFRMSPIARAIVVLKTQARFSKDQIAEVLAVPTNFVDDHIENAQLLFSDGRNWTYSTEQTSKPPRGQLLNVGVMKKAESPAPKAQHVSLQQMNHYLGHDLSPQEAKKINEHFIVCEHCRLQLVEYKKSYQQWIQSLPKPQIHVEKMDLDFLASKKPTPQFGIGFARLFEDRKTQWGLLLFLVSALYWILKI